MKEFKDLLFQPHPIGEGTLQAVIDFDDISVSIVKSGKDSRFRHYSDGVSSYEVHAWNNKTEDTIWLSEYDAVLGWCSAEDISSLMLLIQTHPEKVLSRSANFEKSY